MELLLNNEENAVQAKFLYKKTNQWNSFKEKHWYIHIN
jgi:hypothetical protein